MDAALRELSDQIDQATQRLLGTARIITDPDLRVPSMLPGWTRGHVLAHVARNADGMRNVLVGVRTGQDRPAYASAEAREAGIEQDAGRRATEQAADLASSAMALRTVELHHCDLGAGYGPGDWPAFFADMELAEPMRSWRQDRLSYPEPAPLRSARPPASWRRGRPLPGSWLGTR